jgi:hypothetical protein
MIASSTAIETTNGVSHVVERNNASEASTNTAWQSRFLALLPSIERHAKFRFRHRSPELRAELVEETVARALLDYVRLVQRSQEHKACAGALARYAVAQVRAGRRVGGRLNVRDVSSGYCRKRKGVQLEPLDRHDEECGNWQEILVEDRSAGPADIASARIDVERWLESLSERDRCLAKQLAAGETTRGAARLFGVTAGRISQRRRKLEANWSAFQQGTGAM